MSDPLHSLVRFGEYIGCYWSEVVDAQDWPYLRWVVAKSRRVPEKTREALRARLAELGEAEGETSTLRSRQEKA